MNTKKLTAMALLAALSIILVYLIHFPIFPAASFLEYDPADIPLMIAGFVFGPISALFVCAVTCAIQAMTVSAASGIIGFFMHFFATGAFVLATSLLSKKMPTKGGTLAALICGVLLATVLMIPLNLIFTPMYGTPVEAVQQLMLPVIIPFNLIKFSINAALTFVIYSAIRDHIKK